MLIVACLIVDWLLLVSWLLGCCLSHCTSSSAACLTGALLIVLVALMLVSVLLWRLLGMWGDGAPCNWDRSGSIEAFSMLLPGLSEECLNFFTLPAVR